MTRLVACVVSLVLLASPRVDGSDPSPRSVVIELCDLERLSRHASHQAQLQLIRTFQAIGVGVTVVRCGERHDGDSFRVGIVILPPDSRGPAGVPEFALGALALSLDQDPIVWIFSRRIERAAHRAGVDHALVLGHVMAHEVAHALLPAGHARSGLMRGNWRSADLVDAVQGQLRFSVGEAAAIRDRLTPSASAVASVARAIHVD